MSRQVSLDLRLANLANRLSILDILLANGWRIESNGYVAFLPLGDNDDYDWQCARLSQSELFEILKQKDEANELICVTLHWSKGGEALNVLIFNTNEVSFIITGEIRDLAYKMVDASWYISRILPLIRQVCYVERLEWQEYY